MNEKKFDYVHTCSRMIFYYTELKKKLNELKNNHQLDREIYLIFGPTKSGKSTLLTRLKRDDEPNEFFREVKKVADKRGEIVKMFDDIEASGGNASTTIVPNFHVNRNILFVDLAGFIDIDSEVAPIISLLNYALFPNLIRCKILVVIDINSITNMNLHMKTYLHEFRTLLTDQYFRDGIDSCGFIFTKIDIYENTIKSESRLNEDLEKVNLSEAVRELLRYYVVDVAEKGDPQSVALAGRINRMFISVDYRTDNRDSLIQKISTMMERANWLGCQNMRFDAVLTANILGKEGKKTYDEFRAQLVEMETDLKCLTNQSEEEYRIIHDQNVNYREDIKKLQDDLNKSMKSIDFHKFRITSNNEKIPELESSLIKSQNDIKDLQKQFEEYKTDASTMVLLQTSTIKSSKSGAFSEHWVGGEFVTPVGSSSDIHITILDAFEYDSNHTKIQSCESYKQFEELKLKYWYRDGKKGLDSPLKVDIKTKDQSNPVLSIYSSKPFVVLCCCDVTLKNTSLSRTLGRFHEKRINKTQEDVKKCHSTIEKMREEIKISENMVSVCTEEVGVLTEKIMKLEDIIAKNKEKFEINMNLIKHKIDVLVKRLQKTITERKFSLTEELGEILLEAKIDVSAFRDIVTMKNDYETLIDVCVPSKEKISNFIIKVMNL